MTGRRIVVGTGIGAVALVTGAVAVAATTNLTTQSAGGLIGSRAVTSTGQTSSSASSWVTVPGGAFTMQGPASGTGYLVIRVQGRADCENSDQTPNDGMVSCLFQVTVDGKQAKPGPNFALSAPSGTTGTYVTNPDLNMQFVSGAIGTGPHRIGLQYIVLSGGMPTGFVQFASWSMTADLMQ